MRITDGRVDILSFFVSQDRALTLRDIQKEFKNADRVTLYRTLGAFEKNGILHSIPLDGTQMAYGLNDNSHGQANHNCDHIHFKCDECGIVQCLDQPIPKVTLPGYQIKQVNLVMSGVCNSCIA
ncbi:MAG: transcriptional repressor [Bacteroidota bacterium]